MANIVCFFQNKIKEDVYTQTLKRESKSSLENQNMLTNVFLKLNNCMKNKAHMFPKAKQVQLETFFFFSSRALNSITTEKKIHLH